MELLKFTQLLEEYDQNVCIFPDDDSIVIQLTKNNNNLATFRIHIPKIDLYKMSNDTLENMVVSPMRSMQLFVSTFDFLKETNKNKD